MKLRLSLRALRQIDSTHDFIAARNEQAAIMTVRTIIANCDRLADFPAMGRAGTERGTREWSVPRLPYVLVYTLDLSSDQLVVTNVLHTRRDRPRH